MSKQSNSTILLSPHPFRPTEEQDEGIERLHKVTEIPRAVIVRKLVGFALPFFLSGEAKLVPDIGGLVEKKGRTGK